jgi:hypothetical protein
MGVPIDQNAILIDQNANLVNQTLNLRAQNANLIDQTRSLRAQNVNPIGGIGVLIDGIGVRICCEVVPIGIPCLARACFICT